MSNISSKYLLIIILLLVPNLVFAQSFDTFPNSKQEQYTDAVELKLYAREIASQLLNTYPNELLSGLVALPTSFVNNDNLTSTSSFGRYLAEAMFYEFNLRGFSTREYRIDGKININENGTFALRDSLPALNYNQSYSAVILGTYTKDEAAVFVNVKLIRPDGLVLRVAQIVIPNNEIVGRMTKEPALKTGTLKITKK